MVRRVARRLLVRTSSSTGIGKTMMHTLDQLNAMPPDEFVAALHGVFEHAAWVAETAAGQRPFASVTALQQWLEQNLTAAATEEGRARMAALAVESGWSPAMGRLYFERINYRFTPQHFAGLALFHSRSRLFDEAARGIANAI